MPHPPTVYMWHRFLTLLTSSVRIHGQLVRLYARGIEDGAALQSCSEECNKCERTCILHK